jgi:hypothetical protein
MAKAWKDVIASPQYQALTEEQKAQAQAQYFDEVVAPKAGDKWAEARDQFYAAYPPHQQQKEEPSLMQQAGDWLTGGQSAQDTVMPVFALHRGHQMYMHQHKPAETLAVASADPSAYTYP